MLFITLNPTIIFLSSVLINGNKLREKVHLNNIKPVTSHLQYIPVAYFFLLIIWVHQASVGYEICPKGMQDLIQYISVRLRKRAYP